MEKKNILALMVLVCMLANTAFAATASTSTASSSGAPTNLIVDFDSTQFDSTISQGAKAEYLIS